MFSRFAQVAVKRALPIRRANVAAFSTEAIVPGYGKWKTSTGIVGLPVDPDGVSNMVKHYQALLDRISASDLPETAQYRVDVEKMAKYRIKVAQEYPDDPDMVEELCQCGQVEELIEQAKDEMVVLEMYLKERLWEQIDGSYEVAVEYNPDPSADEAGIDEDLGGK